MIDDFVREVHGPKVQQLLPTMQLDFLRKFMLPKTVHTFQCTRLPVDEVDIASVRLKTHGQRNHSHMPYCPERTYPFEAEAGWARYSV